MSIYIYIHTYAQYIHIYVNATLSICSSPLLPSLCPQFCSLRLHLYSCPADWFISTIFLDSTHNIAQFFLP